MVQIKDILTLEKIPQLLSLDLHKMQEENGVVRLLTAGKFDGYTNNKIIEGLQCGEVLALPVGGNFDVKHHNGFYYSANNYIFTAKDGVDLQYIKHFLFGKSETMRSFYKGWGIKKFQLKSFLELKLNLPSLEKQREIVRILDTITTHTAELTAELTARKKQYNHYREKLLTFGKGVEWKKLGSVVNTITAPAKLQKEQYQKCGKVPIIDQGIEFIAGYTTEDTKNLPADKYIIFGDHSEHIKYVDFAFVQGADGLKILKPIEDNPKYIYYALQNFYQKELNYKRHWSGAKETLIPIPPLHIQKEIVAILDKFDALTTSTKEGLQREIELRQKQYEYYRNQLLNFEK